MIKFAIIGAGYIANRFADSLSHFPEADLYAVSARSAEKARSFQQRHHSRLSYDNYQAVLDKPEVDIVYIALPHGLHHDWVLKALQAGKAVICEKPAALTAGQTQGMIVTAKEKKLFFMEAMKSRFTPAYMQMKAAIRQGRIGRIEKIQADFCRLLPESQATYHYQPIQGGALLDMGIYGISLVQDLFRGPLQVGQVDYKMHTNSIEIYTQAQLIADDFSAVIRAAFDRDMPNQAIIYGSRGQISIKNFHRPESFTVKTAQGEEKVHVPYDHDDFHGEIKAAIHAWTNKETSSLIMPPSDSLACAQLIDAIKRQIPELKK